MYQKQHMNSNYLLQKYPNVVNLYAQYQSGMKPLDFKKNCVFQFIETTLLNPSSKNYQYLMQNNAFLSQHIHSWFAQDLPEAVITWSNPDKISRMMMHRLCAFYGLEHNVEIADAEKIKIEFHSNTFNKWTCTIEEWGEYLAKFYPSDDRPNYSQSNNVSYTKDIVDYGVNNNSINRPYHAFPTMNSISVPQQPNSNIQNLVPNINSVNFWNPSQWSSINNPVMPAHSSQLMNRMPPAQWLRPLIPVPGMPGYGWRIPLYLVAMPQTMLPNSSQVIPQQSQQPISIAPNTMQQNQQQQPICITPVTNSATSTNSVALSSNTIPQTPFVPNGVPAPSSQTI